MLTMLLKTLRTTAEEKWEILVELNEVVVWGSRLVASTRKS